MNNDDNNSLEIGTSIDMPKNDKEFCIKQIEKYDQQNKKTKSKIDDSIFKVILTTIGLLYMGFLAYSFSDIGRVVDGIIAVCVTLGGIAGVFYLSEHLSNIAHNIAKKVGLENRIMELNEALELYELQSNQGYEDIGKSNKVKGKHPNEY